MTSYFYTWNQQNIAPHTIESVKKDTFKLKELPHQIYDLSSFSFQASFGFAPLDILGTNFENDICLQSIPRFKSELAETVANQLINLLKVNEGKIFYTVSGAESVENALKIVRQVTHKNVIAAQAKSYHGATLGALSVTGDWRNKASATVDKWTLRIPDVESDLKGDQTCEILENHKKDLAAVILEPISAINGVFTGSPFYWKKLRKWCSDNDVFLIFDEVVTGFYRTKEAFAFQSLGIRPDIICMAKALTNGFFPMGAVWVNKTITQYYDQNILACGLTNYAHPIGLKIIQNILNLCENEQFQNVRKKNLDIFSDFMDSLSINSRRHGMLAAIELNNIYKIEDFLKEGLYIVQRDNKLILAPHLNTDHKLFAQALEKLNQFIGGA